MFSYRDGIDSSWAQFFDLHSFEIERILASIVSEDVSPVKANIFRTFNQPIDQIRVLILGQDPYPGPGVADGLAFSSFSHNPIPASLRNIFKEYSEDLGRSAPTTPDLSRWNENGVMLLNRTLTTSVHSRNAHVRSGWLNFTRDVAIELARRDVVAILWGNYARELSSLFHYRIESAHPSPLSARKGFFGSRPFSQANQILIDRGLAPIDWSL